MKNRAVTSTEPTAATRPTSLRPRSSSIRCSARSFGSFSSASASAWSSASVLPRGAQRAIKRERGERERRGEPLREDDLEDVAGDDVLLRLLHHLLVFGGRRVGG